MMFSYSQLDKVIETLRVLKMDCDKNGISQPSLKIDQEVFKLLGDSLQAHLTPWFEMNPLSKQTPQILGFKIEVIKPVK